MYIFLPIAILMSISFFVLVVVSKLNNKSLKIFGWIVCVLLWVTAVFMAASACTIYSARPCYGGYSRMKNICPMHKSDGRYDPYHPWRNKPFHRGMFKDPHAGLMMDTDDPLTGVEDDLKCPMADEDMPSNKAATNSGIKK